jgi:signal transduction histidine kinase
MSLRQRIVLTLLAITAILVVPAIFAFFGLRELGSIARDLRIRDTEATSRLGQLQTNLEELRSAQDNYAVVRGTSRDTAELFRADANTARASIEADLAELNRRSNASSSYRAAVRTAEQRWRRLRRVVDEEYARWDRQEGDVEGRYHRDVVTPAFRDMDGAIDPIGAAIDREAEQKVERARNVAEGAGTTTLLALAVALAMTVAIGSVLTRGLLRPIGALRRGMAHVAEGDFEPAVRVPVDRPDELGDLSRSFTTMTEQLAELDRLKAEFVSVASHEIKTPLSVIRGYVSLLADGIYGAVNEQQKKTLHAVSEQTDRLTRLVHRLLDVTRFEAGGGRLEVRRINVRDFLDELTGDFRVLAFQNGIDFRVRVDDDVPVNLEGDADRLNEVLGNLLSNAFKFTARGGRISMHARRDGAGVVVEVADTGVGIPPEKLPRIFEKFYQVQSDDQPRQAGSGLGLAIAREIVEAHGGTITAESEVGKGTTFRVTLPERPPPQRAADAHSALERR